MIDRPSLSPSRGLQLLALLAAVGLTACAATDAGVTRTAAPRLSGELLEMYGQVQDGDIAVPAVPAQALSPDEVRRVVDYWTDAAPGTIIVDPGQHHLYYVLEGDRAIRYAVAVGKEGYGFSGNAVVGAKREWPSWTPTQNMIRRDPELYGPVADGLEGGINNPLGARALYLYRNGRDTMYRIHGTNDVWSIGHDTSAGCIRLFNQDVLDLYPRVDRGTKVVVRSGAEAGKGTVPPGELVARSTTAAAEGDAL